MADIAKGDIVVCYGEEIGIVRSVQPYFGSIIEYWVEFPDKYETTTSENTVKTKLTLDYLVKLATACGMRLERANPESLIRGMRSGYILWTRRGTWLRVSSLVEANEKIEEARR